MREDLRDAFVRQAASCRGLGSDFNGALCDLLAARLEPNTEFGRRIHQWGDRPVPDALALRAVGGLHALSRTGRAAALSAVYPPNATPDAHALWPVIAAAIEQHDAFLSAILDSPPQTNEVARSSALLGVALTLTREFGFPLHWYELGASAGLNLGFDGFRYQFEHGEWGAPEAEVCIRTRWTGNPPALDTALSIDVRAGCDVAPIDPGTHSDRERLLSYIWPDQLERLARTEAALTSAARANVRVDRSAASSWLAAKLAAEATPGTTRVVAHTIVWQYLDQSERASLRDTLERAGQAAGADTPLAWFAMEADGIGPGATMKLTVWPGGQEQSLGRVDFHGRWADWT